MTACPIDGREVTQAKTGRPRIYCSTGCKRTADNEVGRITRRLNTIEARLDDLDVRAATLQDEHSGNAVGLAHKRRVMERETQRLTSRRTALADRMRQLLDTGDADA